MRFPCPSVRMGNMIAASRCVSACLTLALAPDMAVIIGQAACDCQTVLARRFSLPSRTRRSKRQHALGELWL